MITEKINPWLNFAANLGVIAGLILVAMQIQQNTEITKAQIANDYFLADMNLELAMMGDDPARSWAKAVYAPGEIDQHDAAVKEGWPDDTVRQIDAALARRNYASNREMLDALMQPGKSPAE